MFNVTPEETDSMSVKTEMSRIKTLKISITTHLIFLWTHFTSVPPLSGNKKHKNPPTRVVSDVLTSESRLYVARIFKKNKKLLDKPRDEFRRIVKRLDSPAAVWSAHESRSAFTCRNLSAPGDLTFFFFCPATFRASPSARFDYTTAFIHIL